MNINQINNHYIIIIPSVHNNNYNNYTPINTTNTYYQISNNRNNNINNVSPQIWMNMNRICNQNRFIHHLPEPSMPIISPSLIPHNQNHCCPDRKNQFISNVTNPFQSTIISANFSTKSIHPSSKQLMTNPFLSTAHNTINTDKVNERVNNKKEKEKGNKKEKKENHESQHTSRYACNYCDKRFNRRWNLKQHLKTHTKEKPFACDYLGCSMTFSQKHR